MAEPYPKGEVPSRGLSVFCTFLSKSQGLETIGKSHGMGRETRPCGGVCHENIRPLVFSGDSLRLPHQAVRAARPLLARPGHLGARHAQERALRPGSDPGPEKGRAHRRGERRAAQQHLSAGAPSRDPGGKGAPEAEGRFEARPAGSGRKTRKWIVPNKFMPHATCCLSRRKVRTK